jgi:hypothetical protein
MRFPAWRGSEAALRSWISFHLCIGFDALFLFFDDPDDVAVGTTPLAARFSSLSVVSVSVPAPLSARMRACVRRVFVCDVTVRVALCE